MQLSFLKGTDRMYNQLSDLQRDSLMETFNIGVGLASKRISQFTGTEVAISVPILMHIEAGDLSQLVDSSMVDVEVCGVTRKISGIDAEVGMIFQGSKNKLASLSKAPLSVSEDEVFDKRSDIATKIGYLVMESCIDQIALLTHRDIIRHPIKFFESLPLTLFSSQNETNDLVVVKIDIKLSKEGVAGHVLFSFSEDGANALAIGLDKLIQDSEE
jgi:chemotaxis protein CheY-P-specific phosphatase CheC